jgi:hypothetical protein
MIATPSIVHVAKAAVDDSAAHSAIQHQPKSGLILFNDNSPLAYKRSLFQQKYSTLICEGTMIGGKRGSVHSNLASSERISNSAYETPH